MIYKLSGKVIHLAERFLVIDVGGVGFKVTVPTHIIDRAKEGEQLDFWTHLAVSENALDLYGFEDKPALDFFGMLIGISGIGPKTAMTVLNLATISSLKKAVSSGDTTHLVKVSGVGKKIADKIVLELKGKFDKEENEINLKDEVETLEALKAMGYSHKEAREALREISGELVSPSDRIKAALKILGK